MLPATTLLDDMDRAVGTYDRCKFIILHHPWVTARLADQVDVSDGNENNTIGCSDAGDNHRNHEFVHLQKYRRIKNSDVHSRYR